LELVIFLQCFNTTGVWQEGQWASKKSLLLTPKILFKNK